MEKGTNINQHQCLNQIVMLFTKIKCTGSEEFVFPGISNVNVTIKGTPGSVYHSGIKTADLLTEARKTFSGHMRAHDFYCANMCAFCVDMRSSFANNEFGNGRDATGGSGINIEIKRDPEIIPSEDLWCYTFSMYDAKLMVNTGGLVNLIA